MKFNKILSLIGLCLSTACAGNYDEPGQDVDVNSGVNGGMVEIGQTDEAVSVASFNPAGYGMKSTGAQTRCWTNGSCDRPASKVFRFRFHASTCSSWYQARVVTAYNNMLTILESRGWDVQDPSSSGLAEYHMYCGTETTGYAGTFQKIVYTCDASNNCKYTQGIMYLQPNVIQGGIWNTKNETQHQKFVANIALHEMMHMAGLAHDDSALPSVLMQANNSANWYDSFLSPVSTELSMLSAYVP